MAFIIVLILIAGLVRLYEIDNPTEVVFDEVHFGGFASKYITSQFFFDVHPPVGRSISRL
jgi:dolichyl-phosphate-mannose-protein mannosyltransferase